MPTDVVNADVDRQARMTMCLLLEPECFTNVYNNNKKKLGAAYKKRMKTKVLHIQREIFNCMLENYVCIESYISKITFLTQQLSDIDAQIPVDWIISILLGGLTTEYSLIMGVKPMGK
ncbi:unnamed protein product [Arctia plantaginis]|uniref:Uncharacterized protein n=1 Tax=Arctia plantaginis TaxID=874455 RepID=A0A8S0Z060_ARCPL|nr:unnamed protein product [Arctia plantaginis]